MKLISTLLLLVLFVGLQSAKAQTGKTVLDYYLQITPDFFLCDNYDDKDSKDYRIKSIQRMDIRNGYLLSRHGNFIWLQVAVFSYSGKDYIGVVAICGMGCMCNKESFFELQANGDLKDVTSVIFPREYKDAGWIILPEVGTTINIYDHDGLDQYDFKPMTEIEKKTLKHQLSWEKGKFVLKK